MTNPIPNAPKIYHIVHVDRLASISTDELWCDAEVVRRAPPGTRIGMDAIKHRRLTELTLTSHPGRRQVAQQLEKMFTFETELNTIGNRRIEGPLKQTLNFSLPVGNQKLNMTLAIELVRSGSSLRGIVRLRSGALQLPIDFPVAETQLKIRFPDE